jgi:hypothetical protein
MAIIIPTRSDPRYQIEVELAGANYLFDFEWNDRAESWFFDVSDQSYTKLLSGVRIVVGFPLWTRYRNPRLPSGDLSAVDTSGAGLDPKLEDLGDRVLLVYTPIDEIPEKLKVAV